MKKLSLYILFSLSCSVSASSQSCVELNSRAFELIQEGNLDSGLVYIEMAIEEDSTFFGSYYNRGVINRGLGHIDVAIRDFTTSISYNPVDVDSYMNRGILYSREQNYSPALGDFSTVIRLDSLHKEAYFNIGLIYLNTQDLYGARLSFEKCIELDSVYHQAIFRLAKVLLFSQEYDNAYEKLDLCISLFDQDAEYFEFRGIMNFMKGEKEAGCSDLSRASELGVLSPPAKDVQNRECE